MRSDESLYKKETKSFPVGTMQRYIEKTWPTTGRFWKKPLNLAREGGARDAEPMEGQLHVDKVPMMPYGSVCPA